MPWIISVWEKQEVINTASHVLNANQSWEKGLQTFFSGSAYWGRTLLCTMPTSKLFWNTEDVTVLWSSLYPKRGRIRNWWKVVFVPWMSLEWRWHYKKQNKTKQNQKNNLPYVQSSPRSNFLLITISATNLVVNSQNSECPACCLGLPYFGGGRGGWSPAGRDGFAYSWGMEAWGVCESIADWGLGIWIPDGKAEPRAGRIPGVRKQLERGGNFWPFIISCAEVESSADLDLSSLCTEILACIKAFHSRTVWHAVFEPDSLERWHRYR